MELKGFYNESVLQQLLRSGEIGKMEYVMHLSEETKRGFLDYCTEHKLPQSEESAEEYFKTLVEKENKDHEQNMR